MNQDILEQFTEAVYTILDSATKPQKGGNNILDKMEQIQCFYKQEHHSIITLIESTLAKDENCSTPALLATLDDVVNKHFGLDKDIDMTDTIFE
jgi:hypothetical protein